MWRDCTRASSTVAMQAALDSTTNPKWTTNICAHSDAPTPTHNQIIDFDIFDGFYSHF